MMFEFAEGERSCEIAGGIASDWGVASTLLSPGGGSSGLGVAISVMAASARRSIGPPRGPEFPGVTPNFGRSVQVGKRITSGILLGHLLGSTLGPRHVLGAAAPGAAMHTHFT